MNLTEARSQAVAEMGKIPVFRLARYADCGEPDSATSAGAQLLTSVRDSTAELLDEVDPDNLNQITEDPTEVGWLDYDGQVHEVADGAPDVYTSTRWAEFVDLAAYNEDPEYVEGGLTTIAGVALYQIAERLVWALLTEACERIAQLAEEADD